MSLVRIGSSPPPTFEDPVAVLVSCHRKIEDRLAQLDRATAALGSAEALDVLRDVVRHFDSAGVDHTFDEDASVFPRLSGAGIDELLVQLDGEHRTIEAIYLAVRTVVTRLVEAPHLAAQVAADLAEHGRALAAAYRDHMRREEEEVFPLVAKLDPAELRAIGIEMRLRRGGDKL